MRRQSRPRRGANRRPRVPRPISDPNTTLITGVQYIGPITGTGGFASVRTGFVPNLLTASNASITQYSEFRMVFFRYIIVSTCSTTTLGTVFLSSDYDINPADNPASYTIAVSQPLRIIVPAAQSGTDANQATAFGRRPPRNTLSFNPRPVSQPWYQCTTSTPLWCWNYGSNNVQNGVQAAELHIAYKAILRGPRQF